MAKSTTVSPPAKKRCGWRCFLLGAVVLLLVFGVAAWFIATSPAFLKAEVLPRVGKVIGAEVSVSGAVIHPFSEITLSVLKIEPAGRPPLITASGIRVRYHLWDLLRGRIRVQEITLTSPAIQLVENPDGSSNLDPLLKALRGQPSAAPPPAPARPSPPRQIELGQLVLRDATIRKIQNYADGRRDVMELTNLNVTLTGLKNGQTANLQLTAALTVVQNPPAGAGGNLAAEIEANFQFTLTPDLKPGTVRGEAHLTVLRGAGVFDDFSDFSAAVQCDATPTEIRQLNLRFQKAGAPLGELALSGPLNLETREGRLRLTLQGVDRRLLNLAGASSGLDFGTTQVNSTNEISLTNGGAVVAARGQFHADHVQVTRAGQTTPTLDFAADYAVTVDTAAQTARLETLTLAGAQDGRPLLTARLSEPMSLAWGRGGAGTSPAGIGNSALELTVTNLNLADWRPFLGQTVAGGQAGLTLSVRSQQAGRELEFRLNSQIKHLAAPLGGRTVQATVNLSAQGRGTDLEQFDLSRYELQIVREDQPLLTVSGSGRYHLRAAGGESQLALRASLPGLCAVFPQPQVKVSSGNLEFQGRVEQNTNTQTLAGTLTLTNFTGQIGPNIFQDFGSVVELEARRSPEKIQIDRLAGALTQNGNAGGRFRLDGSFDPATGATQLSAALTDFNQNSLRPFLDPLLGGRQLNTVTVNGRVSAHYDPRQSSVLKADLQVTNLVVHDPAGRLPATPLAVGLQTDLALQNQTADLRQLQLALTPTARALNRIELTGRVDFAQPKAIEGRLQLVADSLDVTPFYDLFAGGSQTKGASSASSTGPTTGLNQEPPPMTLPVKNFVLTADIGRLYLRELAVSNLQTTATLTARRATLKPLQCVLNGAPVKATADVDWSVPGYQYALTLDADQVPFTPLVDSFMPDRAGELEGALTAHVQIRGAGVTGASLQKNLTGRFSVGATNLNLSVINVRSAVLKTLVNVVATLPELARNPENAVVALLSRVTGRSGGLMDELEKAPIQVIAVRGQAGDGHIQLEQATVQSEAFEADAPGEIVLAPVLTNSVLAIPVTVAVSQSIAQQLNLTSANASTPAGYVALPPFLTMTGTVGDPKAQIKKTALAGLAVKSLGSGLLNQATNSASRVGNLLNQFLQRVR
jgi:uncharacterized protein involved in outer membrane biogenesis